LLHRTRVIPWLVGKRVNPRVIADMEVFYSKYKEHTPSENLSCKWDDPDKTGRVFWKMDFFACLEGAVRRYLIS
jgi:hypothetical protein